MFTEEVSEHVTPTLELAIEGISVAMSIALPSSVKIEAGEFSVQSRKQPPQDGTTKIHWSREDIQPTMLCIPSSRLWEIEVSGCLPNGQPLQEQGILVLGKASSTLSGLIINSYLESLAHSRPQEMIVDPFDATSGMQQANPCGLDVLDKAGRTIGSVQVHLGLIAIPRFEDMQRIQDNDAEVKDATARYFRNALQNFFFFGRDFFEQTNPICQFTRSMLSVLWRRHRKPAPDSVRESLIFSGNKEANNRVPTDRLVLLNHPAQDVLIQLNQLLWAFLYAPEAKEKRLKGQPISYAILIAACRCCELLERLSLGYDAQTYEQVELNSTHGIYAGYQAHLFWLRFKSTLSLRGIAPYNGPYQRLRTVKVLLDHSEAEERSKLSDGTSPASEMRARPFTAALVSARGYEFEEVFDSLWKLHQTESKPSTRNRYRRILTRLAQAADRLPNVLWLSDVIQGQEIASGGFAKVFSGIYGKERVAIKVAHNLCTFPIDLKLRNELCLEIVSWATIAHRYILPFYGLTRIMAAQGLGLVSPLMSRGTVKAACSPMSEGDKLRSRYLAEIAEGMGYLHKQGVIHGDLRAVNVFVDDDNHVKISDFGLCVYLDGHSRGYYSMRTGNLRWIAPELIAPRKYSEELGINSTTATVTSVDSTVTTSARPTRESDVYAYACLCYELFSGRDPFEGLLEAEVIELVPRPDPTRPEKPSKMKENRALSKLVDECWHDDPRARPDFSAIQAAMQEVMSVTEGALE